MITETNDKNETTFKLIIVATKTEDCGQYTAKIKNALGELNTQTKISVSYGPKFLKELASEVLVNEHETAKLTAEIIANPKAEITWSREIDQQNVSISQDDKFKFEQQQNTSALILKDSLLTDAGEYICIAKNKLSEIMSKSKVIVVIPPKFVTPPESNREVELGQPIDVKTIVRGYPLPDLKLFDVKTQTEKVSSENEIIIKSNNLSETEVEYTFSFVSVNKETPNAFECIASNKSGEASSKFNLNITRKPELLNKPSETLPLLENTELLLTVVVLASPDATIAWFKDNNKVASSKRIQLVDDKSKTPGPKTYSLRIASINKEDVGLYEFIATNKLGEARCSSSVNVEYSPIIVKDLKAKEKGVDGKEFKFECTVKAHPLPEVKW